MDEKRPIEKNSPIGKSIAEKNSETTNLTNEQLLSELASKIAELDVINSGGSSFSISQDEKFYYERKIKPLIDCVYYLALSSNSIANTGNLMQANTYGKKREIRQALDLSNDMNKEIEELFEVLKKRTNLFKKGIEQELGKKG